MLLGNPLAEIFAGYENLSYQWYKLSLLDSLICQKYEEEEKILQLYTSVIPWRAILKGYSFCRQVYPIVIFKSE